MSRATPVVPQMLKGVATPLRVYRVLGESDAQSRLDVVTTRGLTPLVGREQEMGLLLERWAQAQEGAGQVVLLNGEAGIGKSRLVQVLAAQVDHTGVTRLRFRCSSYATNSAFAPVVEHVQRVARFTRDDPPDTKMAKLERALELHPWPRAEVVPLVAALLSLPHPAHYPPLHAEPAAATAEDPGSPGGVAAGGDGAPTGPGGVGRRALGRPLDARIPRPGDRPDAYGSHADRADRTARSSTRHGTCGPIWPTSP